MMDSSPPGIHEKRLLSNGPSFRRSPGSRPDHHHHHHHHLHHFTTTITINRDERGYGMKVSGDNPVYVQSVKEGGAAERAGLHSGDTIVTVNGTNVLHLTHTEVVSLIKAAEQVVLTVQQHPTLRERSGSNAMGSPNLHRSSLHHTLQSRDRITAPQPVDNEKMKQLEFQKAHTLKLMLENEQRYVDNLRSKLAKNKDPGTESLILHDLQKAEGRVQTLQQQLEHEGLDPPPLPCRNTLTQPPRPPPTSPPPLPPRHCLQHSQSNVERTFDSTGTPGQPHHTHQRTKSSPDSMSVNLSLAEASKRLIASESMTELSFAKRSKGGVAWEVDPQSRLTPPGTPPPPYLQGQNSPEHTYTVIPDDDPVHPVTSAEHVDHSPVKTGNFVIHNAAVQQQIISMEDEDMSDQEMTQTEDHGPFRSLSRLWTHQAHLAVFLNYVISNSDPASLLFYLVTDLYKEGTAKEMKKWAYEIHSSFLVPGAPLRLNNVDENIAREIDLSLEKESHKEEILRKIFWKARQKAKEELNEQLADFQAKRTAGLGTIFGPRDSELDESIHDKAKELKIIENILVPQLEPYLVDMERGHIDPRRFSTGAALGTVMGKVFGLRGPHFNSLLERCLTYVSKDKSLKSRFQKTRKMTTKGHHFVAHQYYTVTYCNHCQLIIWGIGPQGYQCTNCGLNLHRHCISDLEESCPGPMMKKEKTNDRISKLMERIRPENTRRKPSSLSLVTDRTKRLLEEEANSIGENDSVPVSGGSIHGPTDLGSLSIPGGGYCMDHNEQHSRSSGSLRRSSSFKKLLKLPIWGSGEKSSSGGGDKISGGGGKRPDPVREASEEQGRSRPPPQDHDPPDPALHHDNMPEHVTKPSKAVAVSRSASVKEKNQKSKNRDRRKTSDPNLSKTNKEVEVDNQLFSSNSYSGSSSNSSLSVRSLDSPSNSTEAVASQQLQHQQPWDSDIESEPIPQEWTSTIPDELRESMSDDERKRQEIINELFYTEKSHVRGLKVLQWVFYRPMKDREILSTSDLQLLFANLEEMVAIHSTFKDSMKALRKESPIIGDVGQLLLNMFDGQTGEDFQQAAAKFCAQQHLSLELLKERRKRDTKFHNFLTEAESNSVCRRLQLKDILPTGMQRLTKYPLLLENLLKYSKGCDTEEINRLQRALDRSKEVLNFVDSAIKEAVNQSRLAELQRRLDTGPFDKSEHPIVSEFRNLDLTRHRLLYEGPLNWRIQNRQKLIDLHVLLLEDAIILLQKQDEKFVLKFYSQSLSPIIKVSTVLVRHNAVDKKALFLVNTSQNGAQIYDFVANSSADKRKHRSGSHHWQVDERDMAKERRKSLSACNQAQSMPAPGESPCKSGGSARQRRCSFAGIPVSEQQPKKERRSSLVHRWFKHISDAAEAYKAKEGKNKRGDHSSTEEPHDLTEKSKDLEDGGEGELLQPQAGSSPVLSSSPQAEGTRQTQPLSSPRIGDGERVMRNDETLATYTEEAGLVEPAEVVVSQKDIHTAIPVLTPLEKLRRKDELVRQALYDKQVLVADLLNVPREEFEAIADLAGEQTGDKDPSELILAAVNEASALSRIVNDALRVSEEDVVSAKVAPGHVPAVPAHKIYSIVTALNSHLSQLLNKMNERDEERERLRKELQKSREQLHSMHERHEQNGFPDRDNSQMESTNPPPPAENTDDAVEEAAGEQPPEEERGEGTG